MPRDGAQPPRLVSVILPVRNGEPHIGDQIAALAAQTYVDDWELIVVDNGSTDRTAELVAAWRDRVPALTVVDASARRGLNHARNAGVSAARGDFLAFCDADDAATPGWLAAIAEAAAHADLVSGEIELEQLNDAAGHAWENATPLGGVPTGDFVPYPAGGNCGMWADVARELSWDEAFGYGGSDMEFGWRASLAGYRIEFVPQALMRIRFRNTVPALIRQHFRYGIAQAHLYRRFGHRGMPRSDPGDALVTYRWLLDHRSRLREGRAARGHWLRVAAERFGRICGSVRWRVMYL